MGGSRKKRRLAIGVIAFGGLFLLVMGTVFRSPILELWYRFQIERAPPETRWDTARELEEGNTFARRVAESWYISFLESWGPTRAVLDARDPCAAVSKRGIIRQNGRAREALYFHYPDEVDIVPAAERLGALKSEAGVSALIAALERSNPKLPVEITQQRPRSGVHGSSRRAAPPVPTTRLQLHFTADALREIGAASVSPLVKLLESDQEALRIQACLTLGYLWDEDQSAVLPVLRGLIDTNGFVRRIARDFCRRHDPDGERAVPILADGLKKEPDVYKDCVHLLVDLLERSPRAANVLGTALSDAGSPARAYALGYLGRFGKPSSSARDLARPLVALLDDPDPVVRKDAIRAIGRIRAGSPQVISNLARVLADDSHRDVRHGAVLALQSLARDSPPAVLAIRKALEDPDEIVRGIARYALENIEKHDKR